MAKPGLHLQSICVHCGKEYRQSKSNQRCCSLRCSWNRWNEAQKGPIPARACEHCGKPFQTRIAIQRYCTPECRFAAEALRRVVVGGPGKGGFRRGRQFVPRRTCELCGKLFYAPPSGVKRGQHRFCSNDCRGRNIAMSPERWPRGRGHGGARADLGNRYFRSSWEANWARFLNFLIEQGQVVSWEYEVKTFEFTAIKKGTRFYTPDFLVTYPDGRQEWDEVKGWMDAGSQTKLSRMKLYYPDEVINLVDKDRYRTIASQVSALIPHWEDG